jgi:hypothetical protein
VRKKSRSISGTKKELCTHSVILPKTPDNAKITAKSGENILRGYEVVVRTVGAIYIVQITHDSNPYCLLGLFGMVGRDVTYTARGG